MATATDTFTTVGVLATPWTNTLQTLTSNGTTVSPVPLNLDNVSIYNGGVLASVGANQYAQAVIVGLTGGTGFGDGFGVCVRWSTANTGYQVVVSAFATNNVYLRRWNTGSNTNLAWVTQAFAAGDVIRLEVTGQDNTTVVVVSRAPAATPTVFTPVITHPVVAGTGINSGFPGLAYSSTLSVATLDNWEGGDFGTPVVVQTARPSADVTRTNFETQAGGTTNLYATLDEASASGADFIRTTTGATSATYVTGPLVWDATFTDPNLTTEHTVRWQIGKDLLGGDAWTLTLQLRKFYASEGTPGTLIATPLNGVTLTDGFSTGSYTLSGAEAGNLSGTDYVNLYYRLLATKV